MTQVIHSPTAVRDYGFDWTRWLQPTETITAAVWTVSAGITRDPGGHLASITGAITTIWLTGGTVGTRYTAAVHIVTSQGRETDNVLEVDVVAPF